jgi:arsenate reductase
MAEGWVRHLKGADFEVHSAGIETHGLNPSAIDVMLEAGVDIRGQRSQHIDEYSDTLIDYVVTVCGHADQHCPTFPGSTRVVHAPFDDPPALAKSAATEEDALDHYRRVRDEIRAFVERLPTSLNAE